MVRLKVYEGDSDRAGAALAGALFRIGKRAGDERVIMTSASPSPVLLSSPPDASLRTLSPFPLASSTWAAAALLAVFLIGLYHHVAAKLVNDWIQFPDYSHGLLIPFFFAFLLWDKRKELLTVPLRQSWLGVPLVAFALLLLLLGVFGADLFISRTSFIFLTAGLVWTLLGSAMLKKWPFLLFVLLLAIPLPAVLLNHITFPLQLFASRIASDVLPLAGVPVLREGNVINLPAMPLEVAEACSGIRSLMSLFTVAVMYGYFMERRTSIRTLLALAALPIAVAANVARIVGTGLCVQYWDPEKALGFFHEFSGWLMFLVSLASLFLTHKLLSLLLPAHRRTPLMQKSTVGL